jgi:hypothetical protein
MNRYQPALLGALFIGILSSLPVLSLANCCCLWVICGGVLTAYLQQQNLPTPLATSDAAIHGLLAGAVGGLFFTMVQFFIMQATGPMILEQMRSQMSSAQMPPEMLAFIERLLSGPGFVFVMGAITVPLYAVFAMAGSLLGLAFFRKKLPPQPQA